MRRTDRSSAAPVMNRLVKGTLAVFVAAFLVCGAASAQTPQQVSERATVQIVATGWGVVLESPGGLGFVQALFIPDPARPFGHTGMFMLAGENGELYGFYDIAASAPDGVGIQHTTLTLEGIGGTRMFQAAGGEGTMTGDMDASGQGTFALELTVFLRERDAESDEES